MADELIDICDENDKLLGVQKMKSEAHRHGLWHRAAHVWIYNHRGEILLQLRAANKELYPGVWDCAAAGHVGAGEDPLITAVREVREEIGLTVAREDLEFFQVIKSEAIFRHIKNNEFYYVYLFRYDGDVLKLKLQKEEVEAVEFFPVADLGAGIKTYPEKYVPAGIYWPKAIEEIKRRVSFSPETKKPRRLPEIG